MKSSIITSDDILGKEAVDREGSLLGVVIKLHVDNKDKTIVGITVDQGFMKPDIFIGIDFIKYFGIDAVLINKVPEVRFRGLKVLTQDSEMIGVVDKVVMSDGKMKGIVVSPGTISLLKENSFVSAKDIKEIGVSVILRKNYKLEELMDKKKK